MSEQGIREEELKALLASEIGAALMDDAHELSERRAKALEYYRGEMSDTPAMVNRSSIVSRDVADTIGWMLPGIIRVYAASDRMAEYEPVQPGDEGFARQATDYINHIFWKDNQGYRILWDATHDSLLMGNGIVKHFWDDAEECFYDEFSGLTAAQVALLVDDGCEIAASKEGVPQRLLLPEGVVVQPTFDVKTKRVVSRGRLRLECVEPENFLIDRQARSIEEARFCAHRDEKSRSELIEMGFARDVVDALPADGGSAWSEESLARDEASDGLADVGHEATRLVEIFECYVKADVDGDGVAETIRAYYAGKAGAGELLDWEVWEDDIPFSDIPCEPVPHRWDARSIADETMDVQRVKTVLSRQMLDNLYASNLPMSEAEQGAVVNPEMLTAPKFGGVIWRRKGLPGPAVSWQTVPFVADKVLVALQHFDQVIEKRTGISRATMALDPEALQNQTATAAQNQRDAAYSQIELVARNQAELGWRRVFRQMLKLIVKHQDRPRTIRLRDQWVEMDPRAWNAGMDVTINVGLGTGSRDRDMAMINNIMSVQAAITQKLAEAGFAEEAIGMIPRIALSATRLAESAGVRNPDSYFPQFSTDAIARMQQAARANAGAPDGRIEAERQKVSAEAGIAMRKAEIEAGLRRERMLFEQNLRREQMAGELALKREQLAAELALKERLALEEMAMRMGSTSGVHVGGEPG